MIGSSGSIAIWVLLGISIALLVAIGLTLNAYREMRRSPYYFQKKQATQRVQNYTLSSAALLIAAGVVAIYAYSPALNAQPQTRLISNAKPLVSEVETTTLAQIQEQEIAEQQDEDIARRITQSSDERLSQATSVETENTTLAATLPDEYYTLSAESNLPLVLGLKNLYARLSPSPVSANAIALEKQAIFAVCDPSFCTLAI